MCVASGKRRCQVMRKENDQKEGSFNWSKVVFTKIKSKGKIRILPFFFFRGREGGCFTSFHSRAFFFLIPLFLFCYIWQIEHQQAHLADWRLRHFGLFVCFILLFSFFFFNEYIAVRMPSLISPSFSIVFFF